MSGSCEYRLPTEQDYADIGELVCAVEKTRETTNNETHTADFDLNTTYLFDAIMQETDKSPTQEQEANGTYIAPLNRTEIELRQPPYPRASTPYPPKNRPSKVSEENKENMNATPIDLRVIPRKDEAHRHSKKPKRLNNRKEEFPVLRLWPQQNDICRYNHGNYGSVNQTISNMHAMAVRAIDTSIPYKLIRGNKSYMPLKSIVYVTIPILHTNYTMCVKWDNNASTCTVWLNKPNNTHNVPLKEEYLAQILKTLNENITMQYFDVSIGNLKMCKSADKFILSIGVNSEFSIHSDRYEDLHHSFGLVSEVVRTLKTSYEVRRECHQFFHHMCSTCICTDMNILRGHMINFFYSVSLKKSENVYPILPFFAVIPELISGYGVL